MKARAAVSVLALALAGHAAAINILTNPSFETGALSPWFQAAGSGVENWNVTNADAHDGTFSATNVGNMQIRQNFTATPVSLITEVSFWIRDVDTSGIHSIIFYYSDSTTGSAFIDSTTSWAKYDVTSSLSAGKSLNGIGIWGYAGGTTAEDRTYLDHAMIDAVPEPASMIALTLGLGAIAVRRRRSR